MEAKETGTEKAVTDFILNAISAHKNSCEFKMAQDAELYYKHLNPTIMNYQKFLYNQHGMPVPDFWAPNNKIASNWYFYFTTQAVQYLLGNGVNFGDTEKVKNEKGETVVIDHTKQKLGKGFDKRTQEIATYAKNAGVCFGFWNNDHLETFPLIDSDNTVGFVPLFDEEDGEIKAGIRFWQLAPLKPLRATLYEIEGKTDYIKKGDKPMEQLKDKNGNPIGLVTYKRIRVSSKIDGVKYYNSAEKQELFPIVPMYNISKQSDLVGNRNTIDAFDLIMSGFINNVDEGEFIYWILKNFGGMTDEDDAKFVERLKMTHVAHADNGDEGSEVEAHKVEVPYAANKTALEVLERQLYKDFMALNVETISAGATNDQIQAAYEPINQKTDLFEYQVTEFIEKILKVAGIEDTPTYTRSQTSNRSETIQDVLSAGDILPEKYMIEKILTLLGDIDKIEEVLGEKMADELSRVEDIDDTDDETTPPQM